MTPEERSKEMKRRMKKWSPEAKAKWSGNRKRAKKEKLAQQRVYGQRYMAKLRGEAVPPLPKKGKQTNDEKREKDRLRHQQYRDAAKKAAQAKARAAAKGDKVVWAKNKGPAKRLNDEERRAKQRIYQARSNARKTGEKLPPLPEQSAPANKLRLTPEEHAAEQRAYAANAANVN